jgi:hypothetical protein
MNFLGYVLQTLIETIKVLFCVTLGLLVLFGMIRLLLWHTVLGAAILLVTMILAVSYGRMVNDQKKKQDG